MNRFLPGLLLGFVLGAGAVLLTRPAPAPGAAAVSPAAVPPPAGVEQPFEPAAPKPVKATSVESAEPLPAAPDLAPKFAALVEKGLGGLQSPEMGELMKLVKEGGKGSLAFLAERLLKGGTSQERFLAGALLEGAGDAAALPALSEALKNDPDELVRRMASHALAVIGTEGAEVPLRTAMNGDKDWGVRVNSAYGLAKLGREDGLKLLETAYTSAETPAEYRLAVLGGLADVAAPSTAPLFRRILSDTKDMSYLFMAVGALAKMKDAGSRADLERLAAAEDVPVSIREAARKALADLGR